MNPDTSLRAGALFRLGQLICNRCRPLGAMLSVVAALGGGLPVCGAQPVVPMERLAVRVSWGHGASARESHFIKVLGDGLVVSKMQPVQLENNDRFEAGIFRTEAGAGDVDGAELTLEFPRVSVQTITNLQSIWAYLLEHTDPNAAGRLRSDPAYRPDPRRLTVQMNAEGTLGFSLTVDQLQEQRTFWIPELDVFFAAGDSPMTFEQHQRELETWRGGRVLDRVRREPEASYEQFTARWEDMGSPAYVNPHAPAPGHIVGITWDSTIPKFGIDRGGGVWNDYGNPDRFRLWFDFAEPGPELKQVWRGQHLHDGLPIITTLIERDDVRFEIEQFAFPLLGPPHERRGDIAMVLLQRVTLRNLREADRNLRLELNHHRRLPGVPTPEISLRTNAAGFTLEEATTGRTLLALQGGGVQLESQTASGPGTNRVILVVNLPSGRTRSFTVKLPSPTVSATERSRLLDLDFAAARATTERFWEGQLSDGARFEIPEPVVNTLFRANLWHALRLPRRHGASGATVRIDLPYSNFAYDQNGTPWPVNQAIYVDSMLYDLRGYPELSAEELAIMFRNNQEEGGHVRGYANWGVYTPAMIYAVARHYLLSGDRGSFARLLPSTLHAARWCLAELNRVGETEGPARGLMLAPLNDLSHEPRAWAFNQAYFFAGLDLLSRALSDLGHPEAPVHRDAAAALREAIARGYGHGMMRSPLVQMRDRTWMPYVPGDALSPGRSMSIWYPTDVDTGPLHLSRLKALDPAGLLTTFLLNDHEDNLFLNGWGMANEPVYNQHATAYLLRDEPEAAIRAFYSMMACAFSHSTFEPVEHRWGWGQYFGPPSTDGAWFDLYRHLLIQERDDDTLALLQATPRRWLEDGKRIRVFDAPTYYGPLSLEVESHTGTGRITATVHVAWRRPPSSVTVRFRHPDKRPLRSALVNGKAWDDFDPGREWVRLPAPVGASYRIEARY